MSQDVGTRVYRDKYRKSTLDHLLRNALIAEKVCDVDRTDSKRIQSPYGSTPTSTVAAIAGSYSLADWQLVDDTLTVTDYVSVAEHIYDFEEVLTSFDVFASRMDQQAYSVAAAIDKFALNELCEGGNGTYSTPSGGFTTAANIPVIMSKLLSKVAGYSEMYKGTYLVIESTDVPGFIQSQAASGFSFADAALNNGFMTNYMGVEVYVAPAGTFVDASTTSASGTKTCTTRYSVHRERSNSKDWSRNCNMGIYWIQSLGSKTRPYSRRYNYRLSISTLCGVLLGLYPPTEI